MSEKITFRELVQLIAEQSQQSQSSTNSFISELVKVIEGGLRETGSLSISGFGKFELRWMKERTGTHPQTGETITIPGQNKVYFKSFKALREDVNRPYANMKAQILEEVDKVTETGKDNKPETKPAGSPAGKIEKKAADSPAPEENEKKKEKDEKASSKIEAPIPLAPPEEPEEEDNGDYLLIERSVPKSIEEEDDEDEDEGEGVIYSPDRSVEVIPESLFSISEPEEPEEPVEPMEPVEPVEPETTPEPIPVSTASPFKQEKIVKPEKKVEKKSGFNWTYVAAGIIVILVIAALFYFLQQPDEAESPQLTNQQQQEQVTEPEPSTDLPAASDEETATDEQDSGLPDDESSMGTEAPADDEAATDTEQVPPGSDSGEVESAFETTPYTINRGESLWSIAQLRMLNPYLWPVIYHLNSSLTDNPNLIPANEELSVPSVSDPENLTPSQLEEVARGYLSVYNWAAEHQPENARYFLWAVGVYSADVLSDAQNRVDPDDWQFAISR